MSPLLRLPLLVAPLLLSCGDKETQVDDSGTSGTTDDTASSEDGPTGDPATVELLGTCPLEERLGGFAVSVYEKYSVVHGAVADTVLPVSILTEVMTEGECTLLRRENPFCDPTCASDETCSLEGECVPYPDNQDLGTVEALGLSAAVSMVAEPPNDTYFDTTISHPAFAPGELVELRASAGWAGAWDLHGVGSEPMWSIDEEWAVQGGKDLVVQWEPPTEAGRAHVALGLNIDQHGASPLQIRCLMEDDGEGTVPEVMITALVSAGVTGFPSGSLSRRTADQVGVEAGCFDLSVDSPVAVDVDVVGYTPCEDQSDCPPGMICNLELQICE